MADATGETKEPLRVAFDRRHQARVPRRQDHLGWRPARVPRAGRRPRPDRDGRIRSRRGAARDEHPPPAARPRCARRCYGRLAGYEDVNDAERLARDPAMRAIVGREGLDRPAASTSQMGRFETEWLATEANLAALTDLSGTWIDRVHQRRPPDGIILDMDSSESPTYGAAGGLGLERPFRLHLLPPAVRVQPVRRSRALPARGPATSTAPRAGGQVLEPVIARYREPRPGPLLPWRRGLRQARAVRAAGGGGHRLRHPPAGQPQSCRSGSATC